MSELDSRDARQLSWIASIRPVAVLFARADSVYKQIEGCEVWDETRDARKFTGGMPVVAHPPCGQWGVLSHLARVNEAVKMLAPFAVEVARREGGVLEHPAGSRLWAYMNLPKPGHPADQYGGKTLGVSQFWWGHRAEKKTWLYVVGVPNIPPIPFVMGEAPMVVASSLHLREIPRAEREHTPIRFAGWLVETARRSRLDDATGTR